jgi:hypothetical protein
MASIDGKLFSKVPKALVPVLQPLRPKIRQLKQDWKVLKIIARNTVAVPHREPVFVLGNQKTGSTAIAALLGMATGLPTTLDLTREVRKQTFRRVFEGRLSFADLISRNRFDFSRPIIKDPSLTFFYRDLVESVSRPRFAFIVRDPRDNIRSILNRVRLAGSLDGVNFANLDHIDPGFMLVIDSRWCGIDPGSHYIDNLAARWNAMADIYLENQEHMHLIRYEDFRRDKVGEIERLAEHLGLRTVCDISGHVDVQYQSKGDTTLHWSEFFGPENLERIHSRCGARLKALGY